MSKPKQNHTVLHWIIIVISILSGLGIWTAVSGSGHSSASASNTPQYNASFNTADAFLSQPYVQSTPAPRFRTRGS